MKTEIKLSYNYSIPVTCDQLTKTTLKALCISEESKWLVFPNSDKTKKEYVEYSVQKYTYTPTLLTEMVELPIYKAFNFGYCPHEQKCECTNEDRKKCGCSKTNYTLRTALRTVYNLLDKKDSAGVELYKTTLYRLEQYHNKLTSGIKVLNDQRKQKLLDEYTTKQCMDNDETLRNKFRNYPEDIFDTDNLGREVLLQKARDHGVLPQEHTIRTKELYTLQLSGVEDTPVLVNDPHPWTTYHDPDKSDDFYTTLGRWNSVSTSKAQEDVAILTALWLHKKGRKVRCGEDPITGEPLYRNEFEEPVTFASGKQLPAWYVRRELTEEAYEALMAEGDYCDFLEPLYEDDDILEPYEEEEEIPEEEDILEVE